MIPGSIPAWAGEPWCKRSRRPIPRVYPRVGGGTGGGVLNAKEVCGLSPRGRGNHCYPPPNNNRGRSIPAWAGEPLDADPLADPKEVYPRVGGGTGHRGRHRPLQ